MRPARLILALLFAAAPALANDVNVEVSTGYAARVDGFTTIHSELYFLTAAGADLIDAADARVLRGQDLSAFPAATLQTGDEGPHRIVVDLIDDEGTRDTADDRLIARQALDVFVLPGASTHTVLVAKPSRRAVMSDFLFHDADGDGVATRGDTLGYQVELDGPSLGGRYTDDLGTGSRLLPGSVLSTHGTVDTGNGATDNGVVVDLGTLGSLDTAVVTYFAGVDPIVVNQGSLEIRGVPFRTDDPDTPKIGDPTVTEVHVTSPDMCEAHLALVQEEIESLTGDPDGDGVVAARDHCPGTPPGAAVDDHGCSAAEFCARIDVSTGAGRSSCNNADWRNDEPLDDPEDCQARLETCEAR